MALSVDWLASNLTEQSFLVDLFDFSSSSGSHEDLQLIIYSGIQRQPSDELLAVADASDKKRRILVHLSDEKLRHQNSLYSRFDVVLRNYFDPRIAWRRNVLFLPLGWTAAFAPDSRGPRDSPVYTWSFCGATKADRKPMVEAVSAVTGGFYHFSTGWDSSDQIPADTVREIYEDSIFVLCPQGNAHVDSFRVMEALQAGAIPVTTTFLGRDFFRYTFGDHPFVVAKTWAEAADRVGKLMANAEEALVQRAKVQDWYQQYLSSLRHTVGDVISGEIPVEQLRTRNRYVMASRFDVTLMASIAGRFRRYRKRSR